jgi:DNA repair exonuclease SbcCD ATPase subunit
MYILKNNFYEMVIEEIGIRNFKSFGNSRQSLKLNTESGELILLVGVNGAGKSTLLKSFDYVLYGKSTGTRKKWSTLSTLPNRINGGDMLVDIKFKSKGTDVEIKRGISPGILELWENGVLNERAGKSNLDTKIEDYVGFDIDTFKSFMSMSVDSFKNFISLTTEEKQLLLDKLFNLEVINILNTILKELNKNNKIRMASLDSEISTLNESIQSIQNSINKSIEKEKENIQVEIDSIKSEMDSKKDDYKTIKDKIEKIKSKDLELKDEMEKEKSQYIILQTDIKGVQKDIDLYDSGKCPTCKTDFDSDHFVTLRSTLVEKKESLEKIKSEIESNIKVVKEKQVKLQSISDDATKVFNDITYFLKNCKSQIERLQSKQQKEDGKNSENIQEFQNTILELNEKKTTSSNNISSCKDKELYYKELNRIFGEDGVKKSIISGIIKPINYFINENIKKMGMHFEVSLDETFTAEIKHLGSQIDHDTLSTGEQKKVNVAILIAYLKLIRTKKHINVLFLDEVFSSIDLEGISDILSLLKSFSNDYNINIFVVHHALLNHENFDRIIRINKEIFSSIEEVNFETLLANEYSAN